MSKARAIGEVIADINIGAEPAPDNLRTAKDLFMIFHGWYGSLFLSRYHTGESDIKGKDRGVKSAMTIWQAALSHFDDSTIRTAVERCRELHPKFPPTLPEFEAICRSAQIRPSTMQTGPDRITMSEGLKSSYTARARGEAMARYRANVATELGAVHTGSTGLGALQLLVAKAVSLAGGDEVATLRRFDRQAQKGVAA